MTHQTHAYHIVNPSPWPLTGALSTLLMTSGLTIWFHFNSTLLLSLGLVTNVLTIYQWWRDTVRESTSQGHHAPAVQKGLWYRMVLFIISEVLFFTGFFWAFYHSSLAPTPELGGCWPPSGIHPLNPLEAPLLNTSVLLASGVSIPPSTSQLNRRQPHAHTPSAIYHNCPRTVLHTTSSLRVLRSTLYNFRQHLRVHFFL